jgi:hypothetical protein
MMRKAKRVNIKAAAPRATATDDDDTSDDNAQTRPTHFTRKASSVAAAATGGGDGSGPSVTDRDRHDVFNVVALLPLVFLTLANFDWEVVWASGDAEAAWTGEYFWQYWVATMVYFSVDTFWVWMVPTCVKAPGVIIKVCALRSFEVSGCRVVTSKYYVLRAHILTNCTLSTLYTIITAPHCDIVVSRGTRAISGVSMGDGRMFIGGDQHLVPHHAAHGLSASGTCAWCHC